MTAKKKAQPRTSKKSDVRAQLRSIGVIRSTVKTRGKAPRQGFEGAPDAWLEVDPRVAECLDGLLEGDDIVLITWLHEARRDVLKVHPRSDLSRPLTGVRNAIS